MRVLIIEDDADVAENVCAYLERRGHTVDIAMDGRIGLHLARSIDLDAVVLDLSLPIIDGLSICRHLRGEGVSPAILMLTARDAVADKVEGFESGADDYLVKPFALPELEIRLRAITERLARWGARELRVGDLVLNMDTREVRRGARVVTTTRAARRVLELLMRNSHRIVTRTELEQMLWPDEPPASDALRTHIHTLRRAIDNGDRVSMIRTITGEGYRLEAIDA